MMQAQALPNNRSGGLGRCPRDASESTRDPLALEGMYGKTTYQ
jgi:hypothetical protein